MSSKKPLYTVDLELPGKKRWKRVIHEETEAALLVAQEALSELPLYVKHGPVAWAFEAAYRGAGGLYLKEMEQWADAMGISCAKVLLLNCLYELSHVQPILRSFGCTTGVRWIEGAGMVHLRTLDWPLNSVRKATRQFSFQYRDHHFVTVGLPGFVGALSGMVPGQYSVTINWAPPNGVNPTFRHLGPAFALREALTCCRTYAEVVQSLSQTPLSTSVFFTVCGKEKGQACIIERTQEQACIRELTQAPTGVLVQANHFNGFDRNNEEIREGGDEETMSLYEDSYQRQQWLQRQLESSRTTRDLTYCLSAEPVFNETTQQRMMFHLQSSEITLLQSNKRKAQ